MSDAKEKFRAFRFAAIIAFVCCLLITGASTGLKKFQLENEELHRQTNVLSAAGAFGEGGQSRPTHPI
jgi:Na+-transporting NADH:ubiquinone oxidoreductase subunit C